MFGLDHELNAKDPMTYLSPPVKKPGFQNEDAQCGEEAGQPRECWCGGTTQNSYQYLMDTFGPSHLEPATLAITEPADGAWVKPGFNVRAESTSQLSVTTSSLQVDGTQAQTVSEGDPLVYNTKTDLSGGVHVISVVATDTAARTFMSPDITVHVTARCDGGTACADETSCLGGYCLPGPAVAGGLGATCTSNEECITGTCGSDGTTSVCTGACDAGNTCPSGYDCLATSQGSGVCWPGEGGGGCSTSSNQSPWLALLGLSALVLIVRRRR